MNPIKCAKNYVKAWANEGSPQCNIEEMEKLIADDIVFYKPLKEMKGKSDFMEFYKMHCQSFSPLHVVIQSSTMMSDGSVAISWSSWGKFAKDFHGIKATGKWCYVDTCSRYYFNDQGKLTKSYDYLDPTDLTQQMKGLNSPKERIVNDYFQFLNGKLDLKFLMRSYHEKAKMNNPRAKNEEIIKTLEHLENFRVCAPDTVYNYEICPSSDCFNLWVCSWNCRGKIEHTNPLSLPVGQDIHLKGITTFRFDHNDMIVEQTDAFDHSHFYKKSK